MPRTPTTLYYDDPALRPVTKSTDTPGGMVVPMTRIERVTSPLPRECSTTEPHGRNLLERLAKTCGDWSG